MCQLQVRASPIALLAIPWVVAVWLTANVAFAQEVPRLAGQTTDLTQAQVLAAGQGQINPALDQLRSAHDLQLFVLFVDSTGGLTVTDFATEVARRNSLGGNDVLLVVAVADRTDAMWRSARSLSRLTDRELNDVLTQRVEPLLGQGRFTDAVVAAAQGLGEVAIEGEQRLGRPGAGTPSGVNLVPLLILGVLMLAGFWGWGALSRRRVARQAAEREERQTAQLAQEANQQLLNADEAMRAANEEIGFAEAQFSPEDVAPYRQAFQEASAELKEAFALRQRLDDEVPEDEATRRHMLAEIIERTRRAQAALEEQRQRIEAMRSLERNAPQILAALPAQLDALEQRIGDGQQTLASLARYAASSTQSVQGNVVEAQKRLAHAREEVKSGQQALSSDSAAAGRSARIAQQALMEATRLLDAIDTLAKAIHQAEEATGPQLAAARDTVARARAEAARMGSSEFEPELAEAQRAIAQAEEAMSAARPDFLGAQRLVTAAQTAASQVLASIQQEEQQIAREREALDAQLQAAESAYARAYDYIAARHGGIGPDARTRLAEAGRHLDQARALAATDPHSALTEAQRAAQLAEDAYSLAVQDFDAYDSYRGGGPFGGGVVVPIPVGIPMGGGWGGGWGGTPWGSGGFDGGSGVGDGGGGVGGDGGAVGGHW